MLRQRSSSSAPLYIQATSWCAVPSRLKHAVCHALPCTFALALAGMPAKHAAAARPTAEAGLSIAASVALRILPADGLGSKFGSPNAVTTPPEARHSVRTRATGERARSSRRVGGRPGVVVGALAVEQ